MRYILLQIAAFANAADANSAGLPQLGQECADKRIPPRISWSIACCFAGALLSCVTACKEPVDVISTPSTGLRAPSRLFDNSSAITFKQVAETFALNGKHTDLQRELLTKELTGKVVEWRIKVYDVTRTEGVYKITSQPYPIRSKNVLNLIRTVAFIHPQDSDGEESIRTAVTDDEITVRGQVQDIVFRAVVVLSPAIIVKQR